MAEITSYYAQRKMPTGVGAAKMDWPSFHAGREQAAIAGFGRAVSGVGSMFAQIAIERRRFTDNATLADLHSELNDYEYNSLIELETRQFTDIKEFEKAEEDYLKGWDKAAKRLLHGQNRRVSEHFQLYTKQRRDKTRSDYHRKIYPIENSFGRAKCLTLYNKYVRRMDLPNALLVIEQHAQYFDPEESQALKDGAPRDVEYSSGVSMAEHNPEALLKMIDDPKFFTGLKEEEKATLRSRARTSQSRIRYEQEKRNKEVQERTEQDGWDLWRDGKLNHDWIRKEIDNLSKSDRDRYTAILDAEANIEAKRQVALDKINENTVKRTVVKMIADSTMTEGELDRIAAEFDFTPTEYEGYLRDLKAKQDTLIPYESYAELSDLLDGVRKGVTDENQVKAKIKEFVAEVTNAGLEKEKAVALGVSYREKLSSAIASRDDPALNTPRANMYFDLLSDLYKDGDIEPLDYDRKYSRLTKYFKDKPDVTAEQAAKFYEELTRDITEDLMDKLWRKWSGSFFGKPYRWLKGEGEKEIESPFPEYPDAFQLGDKWYVIRDGKRYRVEE